METTEKIVEGKGQVYFGDDTLRTITLFARGAAA